MRPPVAQIGIELRVDHQERLTLVQHGAEQGPAQHQPVLGGAARPRRLHRGELLPLATQQEKDTLARHDPLDQIERRLEDLLQGTLRDQQRPSLGQNAEEIAIPPQSRIELVTQRFPTQANAGLDPLRGRKSRDVGRVAA